MDDVQVLHDHQLIGTESAREIQRDHAVRDVVLVVRGDQRRRRERLGDSLQQLEALEIEEACTNGRQECLARGRVADRFEGGRRGHGDLAS
ncbi:hypothetical protein [Burkholderia arboris]|uniref:hypothetical protein n=1 Tax=Burkholderia arboris TaxID=488730 RepID=UPI0021091D8A|nr:hypothetical protein [Burkholderia arboris]UTV56458.1 hypothetical protein NLX30_08830 [Burkholderia arboris]